MLNAGWCRSWANSRWRCQHCHVQREEGGTKSNYLERSSDYWLRGITCPTGPHRVRVKRKIPAWTYLSSSRSPAGTSQQLDPTRRHRARQPAPAGWSPGWRAGWSRVNRVWGWTWRGKGKIPTERSRVEGAVSQSPDSTTPWLCDLR